MCAQARFSWKGLVPDSIYNGDMSHYVYFRTLLGKGPEGKTIAGNAYNYLYKNTVLAATKYSSHQVINNQKSVSIDAVFVLLDKIIANEERKEMAFLQYMKEKQNKGLDISLPSMNENWSTFIKEFNSNIRAGQNAIQRLQVERKRLEYNINTMKERNEAKLLSGEYTEEDFEKAQKGYVRSANLNTSTQLAKVVNFLGGDRRSKTGKKVISYILKKIGPELIDIQNQQIKLNKRQLAALLIGLSHIILDEYNTLVNDAKLDNLIQNKQHSYAITRDLESILEGNEYINDVLNNFLTQKNLPMIADKFIEEYKIDLNNTNRSANFQTAIKNYKKNTEKKLSEDQKASELAKDLSRLYTSTVKNTRSLDSAFKLVSNKSAISELKDMLIGLFNGAIHTSRVGQAQGRADIILGYLDIDTSLLTSEQELDTYYKTANDISKTLEELETTFNGLNTIKHYKDQEKAWKKAINKIDAAIVQLKQIYSGLINCFIIEDSAKFYDSFRVTKNSAGDMTWKAFQGGSLGSGLKSQLSKLNALYATGGINTFDLNWLMDACLNAGPGMIGEANKQNLENYFSAIAAVLLFDNQIGLVREAVSNIQPSGTHVQQLHLFSLNDGFYPLSFLLKTTKAYLQNIYQEISSELASESYGVRVTLSGFVPHPAPFHPITNPMTPESWNEVYNDGLKDTQLEITFLAGFLDLLNAMFNPE